ncbi:tRNA (adenosine(37)-N6)-threonylcarbamoyltransferase complex dimerization subunit type 1 TsaB [Erysipelothrix sp. HDW6C]|uniref:tRNA (adenosine(37)-N6)-threonylcarbamoyltransferase complex dimerization subunit type 1 TsaB n=1 Tax=Erysipelothrix sp. HDW6C TaxID=2714930 RepID=UPI00140BEBA4|nr:tRNA (adenosine(37)-N6)-threonylcarbamoyltransferase complex dimerization subunit type 1 TsaB [Erysipelothrix sp. HDW6C]QIK69924.1 tRNA (adenosine(37)-N6)-threonylcarbamoyltransferase complex dimerization subunit type 1 TsaB [Erysipelothrix sp. HDW6C]
MNTLIIDTSHSILAVGVVQNGEIIASKQENVNKKQSELLLVYIDEVMSRSHLTPLDIDQIVVTNGPGSYTGMRIGLTFAKTYALANPSVHVFTIDTLATLVGNREGFAFIDARSGRVFGAFVKDGVVTDEKVYHVEELAAISQNLFGDTILVGTETTYGNIIENVVALESQWVPVDNPDTLVPNYLK